MSSVISGSSQNSKQTNFSRISDRISSASGYSRKKGGYSNKTKEEIMEEKNKAAQELYQKHLVESEKHKQLMKENQKRRKEKERRLKEEQEHKREKAEKILEQRKKDQQQAYLKYLKENSKELLENFKKKKQPEKSQQPQNPNQRKVQSAAQNKRTRSTSREPKTAGTAIPRSRQEENFKKLGGDVKAPPAKSKSKISERDDFIRPPLNEIEEEDTENDRNLNALDLDVSQSMNNFSKVLQQYKQTQMGKENEVSPNAHPNVVQNQAYNYQPDPQINKKKATKNQNPEGIGMKHFFEQNQGQKQGKQSALIDSLDLESSQIDWNKANEFGYKGVTKVEDEYEDDFVDDYGIEEKIEKEEEEFKYNEQVSGLRPSSHSTTREVRKLEKADQVSEKRKKEEWYLAYKQQGKGGPQVVETIGMENENDRYNLKSAPDAMTKKISNLNNNKSGVTNQPKPTTAEVGGGQAKAKSPGQQPNMDKWKQANAQQPQKQAQQFKKKKSHDIDFAGFEVDHEMNDHDKKIFMKEIAEIEEKLGITPDSDDDDDKGSQVNNHFKWANTIRNNEFYKNISQSEIEKSDISSQVSSKPKQNTQKPPNNMNFETFGGKNLQNFAANQQHPGCGYIASSQNEAKPPAPKKNIVVTTNIQHNKPPINTKPETRTGAENRQTEFSRGGPRSNSSNNNRRVKSKSPDVKNQQKKQGQSGVRNKLQSHREFAQKINKRRDGSPTTQGTRDGDVDVEEYINDEFKMLNKEEAELTSEILDLHKKQFNKVKTVEQKHQINTQYRSTKEYVSKMPQPYQPNPDEKGLEESIDRLDQMIQQQNLKNNNISMPNQQLMQQVNYPNYYSNPIPNTYGNPQQQQQPQSRYADIHNPTNQQLNNNPSDNLNLQSENQSQVNQPQNQPQNNNYNQPYPQQQQYNMNYGPIRYQQQGPDNLQYGYQGMQQQPNYQQNPNYQQQQQYPHPQQQDYSNMNAQYRYAQPQNPAPNEDISQDEIDRRSRAFERGSSDSPKSSNQNGNGGFVTFNQKETPQGLKDYQNAQKTEEDDNKSVSQAKPTIRNSVQTNASELRKEESVMSQGGGGGYAALKQNKKNMAVKKQAPTSNKGAEKKESDEKVIVSNTEDKDTVKIAANVNLKAIFADDDTKSQAN